MALFPACSGGEDAPKLLASTTTDGVKTFSQILDTLGSQISNFSSVPKTAVMIQGGSSVYELYSNLGTSLIFQSYELRASEFVSNRYDIKTSGSSAMGLKITTSGATFSSASSNVLPSGISYAIYDKK